MKTRRRNRRSEVTAAIEQSIADDPMPPEQDGSLGDKTPEYVEWMRDNRPKDFLKTYNQRKTHLGRITEDYYERR